MSLDWNASKIPDWRNKIGAEEADNTKWNIAQAVIFSSLSVGLGTITEDNYRKWYARYTMFYRVINAKPFLILDNFRTFIGLSTNVTTLTDVQWQAQLRRHINDELRALSSGE